MKKIHIPLQIRVTIQLLNQYLASGPGIGRCRMGVFQLSTAVVAQSRFEIPGLFFVKNRLHVHHAGMGQIQVLVDSKHFIHQKRQVEIGAVVARQIGLIKKLDDFGCKLFEGRHVFNILVKNPVNLGNLGRYGNTGLQALNQFLDRTIRLEFDPGELHDPILTYRQARCFQVKKDQRPLKTQVTQCIVFHSLLWF